MFLFGKAVKYSIWTAMGLFMVHLAMLKKMKNVDESSFVIPPFLDAAKKFSFFCYDTHNLFTKPGMTKMLPDRMNLPGMQHPKTLIVNLNGTLVH